MRYFLFVFLTMLYVSCNQSKSSSTNFYGKAAAEDGNKLLENKCNLCHNPTATADERVAPPMMAVKKHYLEEGMGKDEFIAAIQNWIKNPTPENVKMHGAVKKFGIMPKQVFSESDIEKIAGYMYDTEFKPPGWYKRHQAKEMANQNLERNDSTYADLGLKYAKATKAVLGKNLMKKIQTEGTEAAISFCNVKAMPLTDSMSVAQQVGIQRVSDKPRNPKNKASQEEQEYIALFKSDIVNQVDSKPIVKSEDEVTHVYYPITTNGMCLQCHGAKGEEVKKGTVSMLAQLYPEDRATGYGINQVRGIWKVSFKK